MVTDRLNGDELTNACAASAVRGRPPNFDLENISTAVNVVSDMIARVAFDWGGQ
jgi:hypothetical protein